MAPLGTLANQVVAAIPDFARVLEVVGLAEVIDARQVEQQVEAKLGRVAQRTRRFEDILARHVDAVVAAKAAMLHDQRAEPRNNLLQQGGRVWRRGGRAGGNS